MDTALDFNKKEKNLEQLQNFGLLLAVAWLELSSCLFHCSGLRDKSKLV